MKIKTFGSTGGKITIKLPDINLIYYVEEDKKRTLLIAKLLESQIKKSEFCKKIEHLVEELKTDLLENFSIPSSN